MGDGCKIRYGKSKKETSKKTTLRNGQVSMSKQMEYKRRGYKNVG